MYSNNNNVNDDLQVKTVRYYGNYIKFENHGTSHR